MRAAPPMNHRPGFRLCRSAGLLGLMAAVLVTTVSARASQNTMPTGHNGDHMEMKMERPDQHVHGSAPEAGDHVGVTEQLGKPIALDATFRDEDNRIVRLGDLLERPTLLLPVYFYCPQACSMMLGSLASALNDVPLEPGREYQVLAVSFDAEETPSLARTSKTNYMRILQKDFPGRYWRFLTGEQKQIDALLGTLGYRVKKTGPHQFVHPNVLITLAPDGKIIRYLYGLSFLPFDIGMALTEADKGNPQISVRRVLTYCFDYDPSKKTYVFHSFRMVALGIILVMVLLLIVFIRRGNPRKKPHLPPDSKRDTS